MTLHTLPFENRWSDREHAWQWHAHLERIGLENTRHWFIVEATRREDAQLPSEVPLGFVRDWLDYHDRVEARRVARWQSVTATLTAVAAAASSTAVWLLMTVPR
jgi:hypothetical protein